MPIYTNAVKPARKRVSRVRDGKPKHLGSGNPLVSRNDGAVYKGMGKRVKHIF